MASNLLAWIRGIREKRKIRAEVLDKILNTCGLPKRELSEKDGHVRRRIINALLEID